VSQTPKPKMTQEEVMVRLQAELAPLVGHIEPDRSWLWCSANLKGCGKSRPGKPCPCERCTKMVEIRTRLKAIGFAFTEKGHTLASGSVAYWYHTCDGPAAYRGGGSRRRPAPLPQRKAHQSRDRGTPASPTNYAPVPAASPELANEAEAYLSSL
jgi:hypothetical protein